MLWAAIEFGFEFNTKLKYTINISRVSERESDNKKEQLKEWVKSQFDLQND